MRFRELPRTMHRSRLAGSNDRSYERRAKYLRISGNATCVLEDYGRSRIIEDVLQMIT